MKIRLGDIEDNPFRDRVLNPVQPAQIAFFKTSFSQTGDWGNTIVRPHPDKTGKYQRAFGHARGDTLLEVYGPDYEGEVILREWSNKEMLLAMAAENTNEKNGSTFLDRMEIVKGAVKGFAEGIIELKVEKPYSNGTDRYAPSFITITASLNKVKLYTTSSVADYLGDNWTRNDVSYFFLALELIEQEILSPDQFMGLSNYQAISLVYETRKARAKYLVDIGAQKTPINTPEREAEDQRRNAGADAAAKKVGKNIAADFKSKNEEKAETKRAGRTAKKSVKKEPKTDDRSIDEFVEKLTLRVNNILGGDKNALRQQLDAIVEDRDEARMIYRSQLRAALWRISKSFSEYAEKIIAETPLRVMEGTVIAPAKLADQRTKLHVQD